MKITARHIEIYEHYGGNGDALVRLGTQEEQTIMTYETWRLIDSLIQDIELISNGLASESFRRKTEKKLESVCDSKKTESQLKSLAHHP